MRIVFFCHSILSDWNHGNAHLLRGVATELIERGFEVDIYEPRDAWSITNLLAEAGEEALQGFQRAYPKLHPNRYRPSELNLAKVLSGADLVLVHEWNSAALVKQIGAIRRKKRGFILLFHDTHHRSITDSRALNGLDLSYYDGVLAFGRVLRDLYLKKGWARRAWIWHEAVDPRVFHPLPEVSQTHDLVWIGNWGDEERTAELQEYLLRPVRLLRLKAKVYGVRYPESAKRAIAAAGIEYRGWLPNYQVPRAFASAKMTLHVPRRPYATTLPGIPTIRPFEALGCGIPLICSPWRDVEGLFEPGKDYLSAKDGDQMARHLLALLADDQLRRELSIQGRRTVLARHTCAHRVDELLEICCQLGLHAPKKLEMAVA